MPSKNTVKSFDSNAYYHVYNRGVEKRTIFIDEDDYAVFMHLLKRYLSTEVEKDAKGREYQNLSEQVEIAAFCLMPNHFHLLIYQIEPDAMTTLLRAVSGSYTVYFNKKYDRVGSLFQATYKAKHITNDAHFLHITRYIHLNPEDYLGWEWSSCRHYLGYVRIPWLHEERVLGSNYSEKQYQVLLEDYVSYKKSLEEIGSSLASI